MQIKQVVLSGGRVRTEIIIEVPSLHDDQKTSQIYAVAVQPDGTISWSIFGQRSPAVARQMAKALIKAAEIAEKQ